MKQPKLKEYDLDKAMAIGAGSMVITFSIGQWDHLLQVSYDNGAILVLMNDDEEPIAAYKKES